MTYQRERSRADGSVAMVRSTTILCAAARVGLARHNARVAPGVHPTGAMVAIPVKGSRVRSSKSE